MAGLRPAGAWGYKKRNYAPTCFFFETSNTQIRREALQICDCVQVSNAA
jgi:hypothetical protein